MVSPTQLRFLLSQAFPSAMKYYFTFPSTQSNRTWQRTSGINVPTEGHLVARFSLFAIDRMHKPCRNTGINYHSSMMDFS